MMFNSALVYELSALKPLAEPLLRQVQYRAPEYIEARRLLAFLEWFLPLDASLIPANSIVREFLGGSGLKDFKIWRGCSNRNAQTSEFFAKHPVKRTREVLIDNFCNEYLALLSWCFKYPSLWW